MSTPSPLQALAQAGLAALRAGDAPKAAMLFEQIVAAGEADAAVWLALASARGALGEIEARRGAIDAALALEPRNPQALMAKADHLTESGDARTAVAFYRAVLQGAPAELSPQWQDNIRRARTMIERFQREFEEFIRARLNSIGLDEAHAAPRFSRAVDILLGTKRVYLQEPRYFYYPELPQIQFYPREDFPWLDAVEDAVGEIRAELRTIMADTSAFTPYVTQNPNRPQRRQAGMAGNPDWSAYFLCKEGKAMPGASRCPQTMAALGCAPLTQIPNRAPAILFSQLRAGAQIPRHVGMINTRLICHLPLIIPPGCEFRVGNETRTWVEGKAWVFDDTIEHEAWNRSDESRFILIFDIWRPELSEEERAAFVALCEAVDSYGPAAQWSD